MASILSNQLEEVRCHAEACLHSTGSVLEIRAGILAMANIPLPPSAKYHYIAAETMIIENSIGNNRKETIGSLQRLSTALNILEKYGCNLTSSSRPKYWRTVKHNNPVFRATVDAIQVRMSSIQGGRAVLCLYGYSNQQPDGLSFPDVVVEPDIEKVAAVTLEVMSLRMELDMLIKEAHPHPEFFERMIPSLNQKDDFGPMSDAVAIPSSLRESQPLYMSLSSLSQSPTSAFLPVRTANASTSTSISTRHTANCTICAIFPVAAHCNSCVQWLCTECDRLYHSSAERANHHRTVVTSSKMRKTHSSSLPSWHCTHCTRVNSIQDILCEMCERPRLASSGPAKDEFAQPFTITEWQCKSCTVVNAGSSILCEVCERPRLATKPPATPTRPPPTPNRPAAPVLGMPGDPDSQWMCQFCTYINYTPASVCEMCDLPRPEPAKMRVKLHPPSQVKRVPVLSVKPKDPPMEDPHLRRQKLMREEGLKLIQLIRDGEKKGVSPEEVYTGMRVSGDGNILPCDWLKAELPHLLDQICATASSSRAADLKAGQNQNGTGTAEDTGVEEEQTRGRGVTLSRAEAKLAWLSAGGDTERAAKQALRDRHSKVKELCSLGFTDEVRCQEVLRQSEGEVRGALSLLQRPLMEPFHQRMWSDQPEPPIDINHPDKQRVCRRLLAVYDLPSWGRCELALSLLQERTAPYSLDDVVQAVRESHDRDFIRRVLAKECPICLSDFPHSKMQSLTSCQCSVCCGCFQQHFTIAVRDKHIRDMVCPVCWEPDINDPEHLNSYFSTLDIQLRECLEPEVYDLFHKKLTEQALIKDPKFLWCSHCSYGFIYDGDQLKVTCFQCRNSFCAQCKKPWESQHGGLSCEQYQSWKRENDPEYQRQGLAGYLRDNGITCPNCRFQYALSKGGCMHFCCSQCRYQFCSGCNNPFHTTCAVIQCSVTGLHAHHPRDCLFYLRDWEPVRLQALLQNKCVEFNTDTPPGTQAGMCGVIEQKDEGGQQTDSACGAQTQPGHAGLCEKHYREYLVSLINGHSIDPAPLFNANELVLACRRYQVDDARREMEDDVTFYPRMLEKLIDEVPLGDKVPRKK
nr:E3 ubiquitin-protein ligase RNF31 isoform X1 [Salvelinus alpinus]XP_023865713.1 E3 ubiquitin-protein ligase RNF31 isoform X1 [Salvelinus alpinus]